MSFLRLLRGEREAQNAADGHSLPAKNKWRFKKMLTKACWTSDWRWIEWGRWRRGRNLPAQVLIQFSIVRRWDWRWRPSSPIFYCASFPRPSSSPFPDSIPLTLIRWIGNKEKIVVGLHLFEFKITTFTYLQLQLYISELMCAHLKANKIHSSMSSANVFHLAEWKFF